MTDKPTILSRAARWTRVALLAAIAIVLGLIVTTPRNEYPLTMSRAQAAGIGASSGYLLTSMGKTNQDKFFLVDTAKQVICVYDNTGDKLRLISARKFDLDAEIPDGSLVFRNIRVEGNANGITREEARIYGEEFKAKYGK